MLLSIIIWRVLTGVKFLRKSWPKYHGCSPSLCRTLLSFRTVRFNKVSVLLVGPEWLEDVVHFIVMDSVTFKTCLFFNACTFLNINTFTQLTPCDSSKI